MPWNDPNRPLPVSTYTVPEPRRVQSDRRSDDRRATIGDRRTTIKRALHSLLRL